MTDLELTPESGIEYTTARRQAEIEDWMSFFTGRPNDLLSFEEVKQNLRLQDSAYKGLHEIELDKIVGSTGRYRDFTRSFLPKNDITESRWRRVDAVAHEEGYPPIEVYQVGDVYFVRDGNHRVSVAHLHGAKTIEAYVIEYKTPVDLNADDDLDDILLKMEHVEFFRDTRLQELRPEQSLEFTEPGRYRLVKEHIAFHKFLKEKEEQHSISYEAAVASWYDNVYLPVVDQIRSSNVLQDFPGRTEADLYAWMLLHRARFEQEAKMLGYVPTEDLIEQVKRERATNPFARVMGLFRHRQGLTSLPLKMEQARFLEEAQLDDIRPGHGIKFSESGCYELAKHHINDHKFLKEKEVGHHITYEDAVASWYDNVYQPIIQLIRERGEQKRFPKNTEGDLYIWLLARREILEDEANAFGQIPTERLLEDLEHEISTNPLYRLIHPFGQKLDLQSALAEVL